MSLRPRWFACADGGGKKRVGVCPSRLSSIGLSLAMSLLWGGCALFSKGGDGKGEDGECVSKLNQVIHRDIEKLGEHKPIRSAASHLTFPRNQKELEKLEGMAILALSFFSQRRVDFPVQRVRIISKAENKVFVLPRIFPKAPIQGLNEGSHFAKHLGNYRQTLYYFAPIALLKKEGGIELRYGQKKNKDSLFLLKLPASIDDSFIKKQDEIPYSNKTLPEADLVLGLLRENYCLPI